MVPGGHPAPVLETLRLLSSTRALSPSSPLSWTRKDINSFSVITSLFALTLPEEFSRVLGDDGYYFQVLACQDHLLGLKSIIYDELKFKEKDSVPELPGFVLHKSVPIRFTFTVEGEQIQNLFSMTPHVFRIGKEGAERLKNTKILTDTASCVLNVYRREC